MGDSRPNSADRATNGDPQADIEHDAKTLVAARSAVRDGAATMPMPGGAFGDRYELVEPIGRGGMGVVVAQHDTLIGRRVAMKVMHANMRDQGELRARFVREARVQGQLEHPAVVPVYDLGVAPDGDLFFTMKRVRGDTLADVLERQWHGDGDTLAKYTRRRLLTAMSSVCLAVQFAHERGVLHRDLKPENIMLGDFGEVYVLDWGLAHLMTPSDGVDADAPLSNPGDIMGTPGYMAPEQALGVDEEITTATDVYALGTILFELLTLKRLHEGNVTEEVIASTLKGANAAASLRAPNSNVPPELEQLCVAATQLDPLDRPASARAMHAAIERYLEGERDEALRQTVASRHADEATHLVEQASSSDDLTARQRAMQELGRSLALDPSNATALRALVELLSLPPKHTPAEVEQQMAAAQHTRKVAVARIAALAYPIVLLFLPLFYWIGVRNIVPIALIAASCALAGFGSWWVVRFGAPADGDVVAVGVLATSTLGFATSSTFYGPLIIAPGAILINTLLFAMYLRRSKRWIPILIALLGTGIPLGLELAGVTHSYVQSGESVAIMVQALTVDVTKMLWLGAATTMTGILLGTFAAGWFSDLLVESEGRLLLRDWHLRQILGQPAADSQRGAAARSDAA